MVFTTQHFHISSISQAPPPRRRCEIHRRGCPAPGPLPQGARRRDGSGRRSPAGRPERTKISPLGDGKIYENLWTSMKIYEDLWKSMKIWYFYIVTPQNPVVLIMAFPRKIDILRAVAHFQIHPTGKFGREPGSGDKPDTDQISNILVRHVPNKQQGIRPKCRFHQQIKRGTLWVANSCS